VASAVFTRSSHFYLFVLAGGVTIKAFIYLSPVFPGKHFTTARFRSTTRSERVRLRGLTKAIPGTLQEGGAPFETTHWTVVLEASKAVSDEAARKALAVFSEAYWPPLYTFVRRRGYSPADAQDLIQGFFVHLFEQNTLSRADKEKGRLRTFLLGSLQNFLLKERERLRAIKRGGNQQFVSFDLHLPQAEAAMFATAHLSDVNAYDVAWASGIVTRVWKNMRERFAVEGRLEWFDELRPFVAGGPAVAPDQEEVARRLGTSVENLRVWLTRLRQRYRNALRAEVASTVSNPAEIDAELHYIYQILTS
jgi:DNA-directed RNA polymerase specialized sigma24 family protein